MSTGDKEFNRQKAETETVRILAERFGLEATIVDGAVRVVVPVNATAITIEGMLDAMANAAADVNKKFGTKAFVSHKVIPHENPPVTAAVTPEPEPVYTGKLATTPPEFVSMITRAVLKICAEVSVEVMAATDKHGLFASPHEGHSVIREELEELFDEIRADVGKGDKARREAIQIAATAIKYVLMLGPPFGSARCPEKHHKVAIEIAKHT